MYGSQEYEVTATVSYSPLRDEQLRSVEEILGVHPQLSLYYVPIDPPISVWVASTLNLSV